MLLVLSFIRISFINVPKMLEHIPPASPCVSCEENSWLLRTYMKKEHLRQWSSPCYTEITSQRFRDE